MVVLTIVLIWTQCPTADAPACVSGRCGGAGKRRGALSRGNSRDSVLRIVDRYAHANTGEFISSIWKEAEQTFGSATDQSTKMSHAELASSYAAADPRR